MISATNVFQPTQLGRLMSDVEVNFVDIGARFGFDMDLSPLAFAANACGFEPHPEECARLIAAAKSTPGPWKSVHYTPLAVSGTGGKRVLHVPESVVGASILEHDPNIGRQFQLEQLFRVARTFEVDTVTLDEALETAGFASCDYLKLDIEGAELEVLQSGPRTLKGLLAIKTEVAFLEQRRKQPLASDVDLFLRKQGFTLMDMTGSHRWRREPGIPHPQIRPFPVPYSKGQIAQCDYLYFRNPSELTLDSETDIRRALKLASIAMAFGHFDFASMLFKKPAIHAYVSATYAIDPTVALGEASRVYGTVASVTELARQLRDTLTFARSLPSIAKSYLTTSARHFGQGWPSSWRH